MRQHEGSQQLAAAHKLPPPWLLTPRAVGGGDAFAASAAPPEPAPFTASPVKPGAAGAAAISLTASAHTGGQHALPAYLFAEPTPVAPPPYAAAAAGWGTHVAGASAASPKHASHAEAPKAAAASPADELFSDFSPFK